MTTYLLSVQTSGQAGQTPRTSDETERSWQAIGALEAEMRAGGVLLMSGRLDDATSATVVRVKDEAVLITDGPFIETKEHLGGFYIIEAPDLETAHGWAAKVAGAISEPIEVRPFVGLVAE
jgi:hypothetical protein